MPSHNRAPSQTTTCNIFVHEGLTAALHRVKAGVCVDEPKTGDRIDEFMEPHEHWARYMDRVQDLAERGALRPDTLGVARELRDRLLQSLDMYHRSRGEELRRALRGNTWEKVLPSIEPTYESLLETHPSIPSSPNHVTEPQPLSVSAVCESG